jgi:membrane protease YdiL (CAAX protease family)
MNEEKRVFSQRIVLIIVSLYLVSGLIIWWLVGPWEALRQAFVNGLLAFTWLAVAHRLLKDEPIPPLTPLKRPGLELFILLLGLAAAVTIAALDFLNLAEIPSYLALIGTVLAVYLLSGYSWRDLGIRIPARRAAITVGVVILINFAFAILFQLLPRGEAVTPPGADLAEEITGPLSVLILFGGIFLRAALPEELMFRVAIQPRLVHFMSIGGAILLQALLFSAAHFPQQYFDQGQPFLLSLGHIFIIENGLIAGYIWYRTRNLPLLLVMHLLAFPRIGI